MTENSPTDPSAPAAPVEVEGEAVELAARITGSDSICERVTITVGEAFICAFWAPRPHAARLVDAVSQPRPAAPTTPDIADERMRRALVAINDLVRGHDDDPCEGCLNDQACEIGEVLNILDALGPAALATPSTPGAGQADEGDARKWRCLGPGGSLGNKCTPDNPHASWRFNGCGWTPEPATGQGEPS